MKTSSQSLRYGWASLWRAHTSLPRDLASAELTVFVRAIGRQQAHAAMGHAIHAMYPAADLEGAYYNLSSAHELVEQGVSPAENDRLFETAWQGDRVEAWVENPVFAVADAAELFVAWMNARNASQVAAPLSGDTIDAGRSDGSGSPELTEQDRPLFIAAALRGLRLQVMPDGYYGLYRRDGQAVDLVAEGLTFKDVANRCGAFGTTTLRAAAQRDGLVWPDTSHAFLALARQV